jgi:hypothetical protein
MKVMPMEQPREQQPSAGPVPYPYALPYQQPPRPSVWRMFTTFLRVVLRRLLYAIIWVLRPLRPYAIFAVIVLGLLGVIGWMGFQLWVPKVASETDIRVAALAPSAAVQNYMTGRRTYNAELMWEAFSDNYHARQLQNGGSKATMQSLAKQEQRLGLTYRKIQYIGGVKLEDGGHMYTYSVDVVVQTRTFRLPVIFMSNRDEKIEYIISPIDDIVQQLTQ